MEKASVEDSYWVVPDRFLAGPHPGPCSLFGSPRKLRHVLTRGIDCFLDLTEVGEIPSHSALVATLAAELGRKHVRLLHRPLREHRTPTVDAMRGILDEVDVALSQGRRTFVHCRYGVGRTSMVVACWLIRHQKVSSSNVLYHMDRLRSGLNTAWRSPNIPLQRRWVTTWLAGT